MDNELLAVEDLLAFVEVADAKGFTAASRRTGIPKSRLSRRVAALETFLGVALVRRDARRFVLTEVGERVHGHGRAVRSETRSAISIARESLDAPWGQLRVACPSTLATSLVSRVALDFSARYPQVLLTLQSTDGRQRPIDDAADLLIQPTTQPLTDSSLVSRLLAQVPYALYASPALAASLGIPDDPEGLQGCPAIGWSFTPQLARWQLHGPRGRSAEIALDLRFVSDSLSLNSEAAVHGLGVAQLPQPMAASHVRAGRLRRVLAQWAPPDMQILALYPSRRHLTLAGRCFLDMLEQCIGSAAQETGLGETNLNRPASPAPQRRAVPAASDPGR